MRSELERRRLVLLREREAWEPVWKELARQMAPYLGYFDGDQANDGRRRDDAIIDGTPLRAAHVFVSGLQSGLTSPARQWFRLALADPDLSKYTPVRAWLDDVQMRMTDVFAKSNFYNELLRVYNELSVFGTAAVQMNEDYRSVIRCRAFTAGEYALGLDSELRVDTLYRKIRMTPRQMAGAFGEKNMSQSARDALERGGREVLFDVHHLIEPNDGDIPGVLDDFPFRAVYWENAEDDKLLRVAGYHEFPAPAPRWNATGRDIYGRGPGWDALGDCRMLQKMQEDKLKALDKFVDPPMQAPNAARRTGVNLLPGGINYHDEMTPNSGVRPVYQIQPDLQALEFSVEKTQEAIRQTFFNDLFLMIAATGRPQMTAREVAERYEEKLLMLGPLLERTEGDLLSPAIGRTFSIMERVGLIPPPPPEAEGMDLNVEYVSLLAQAQKMVGTAGIEQFVAFAGGVAGGSPEALDTVNADEAVRIYADMLGVPATLVRSEEDVASIREQRRKQMEAQQQAQMGMQAAQGAKTLSETNTEGNNALSALLSGLGGPGTPI